MLLKPDQWPWQFFVAFAIGTAVLAVDTLTSGPSSTARVSAIFCLLVVAPLQLVVAVKRRRPGNDMR